MNVTGPLIELITNDADCVALISSRVYPVILPQKTTYPAAVITVIGNDPNETKSGSSDVDNIAVQIDAYAFKFETAAEISEAIRQAIDFYTGDVVVGLNTYAISGVRYEAERANFEADTDLWRISADYTVRMLRDGSAGDGGGNANAVDGTFIFTAGETMSSGRAVVIEGSEAFYFQPANAAHAGRVIGVTTTSASAGNDVTIQIMGIITDAAYTFNPDLPVYARTDGELFNTPGASGISQYMGVATGTDTLMINIGLPIVR
jgi:Protein of unknown function (DUF3168)/Uncharacterized conserved protein (DUF2190)